MLIWVIASLIVYCDEVYAYLVICRFWRWRFCYFNLVWFVVWWFVVCFVAVLRLDLFGLYECLGFAVWFAGSVY